MPVRLWIAGGVGAAALLAGCGGASHTTARSTTATASTAASAPPAGRPLPPGAPAALRGIFGRVLTANELQGFTPQGRRLLGINATGWVVETEVPASQKGQETARLEGLGFVAGVKERLTPTKGIPAEGLSIVEQFRSSSAAQAELAAESRLVKAAGPVATFSVAGIPGAIGFGDSQAKSSDANVAFSKGSYYYLVGAGWQTGTPSSPTRAGLIAAAQSLYKRVHA